MKHLGYGNQPYLVYKHADLELVHFHIVSTCIDCDTGKKVTDSYEKEKTQRFIKDLEQKYQLTKDKTKEKLDYRFSGSSKNLKQNLECFWDILTVFLSCWSLKKVFVLLCNISLFLLKKVI